MQLTADGRCPACSTIFTRKNTWASAIKRFRILCEENKSALDILVPTDYENHGVKLPIMIGKKYYSVPLRYLVEFENIMLNDDDEVRNDKSYEKFFIHLSQTCKILNI